MGCAEFLDESLVPERLIDRGQRVPLKVLDQCEREKRAIVDLTNDRGNFLPLEIPGRTVSALPGDDFITVTGGTQHNRLEEAGLPHRLRQLVECAFVEDLPRLERVGPDTIHRNGGEVTLGPSLLDGAGPQQGLQTAPQPSFRLRFHQAVTGSDPVFTGLLSAGFRRSSSCARLR